MRASSEVSIANAISDESLHLRGCTNPESLMANDSTC